MNITNAPKLLDGTTGGQISVIPEYHVIQIVISGRATGTITISGKSLGSDIFEAFQPALTINLAVERTAIIDGNSLSDLNFSVNTAGDDFNAIITQWPSN